MHFSRDLRTILKLSIDGATRRLFAVVLHDCTLRAVMVPGLCGRLLVRPNLTIITNLLYINRTVIHLTRLDGVLKNRYVNICIYVDPLRLLAAISIWQITMAKLLAQDRTLIYGKTCHVWSC